MILMPGAKAYDQRSDGLPPIECENWYAERTPKQTGVDWVLVSAPGQEAFAARTSTPQGGFAEYDVFGGDVFTIYNGEFERTDSAGVTTQIATLTETGRAIFTSVRGSLVFCVGGNAFVYDGTALTEITDVDLPTVSRGGAGISSVTSMDGRIIFTEEGTDRLWWSGIFNPSDIDVLAFATAETFEDRLVRAIADHRELWLFGHKTIEIWRPVANSEQPFQRIGDMVIEKGCLSRLTIAKCDNTLFWVGQDAIVYRAEGITPKRISNHGIDRILSKLTEAELTQLHAFSYTDEGHAFYILTVPGVKTFCYDASTGEWHTRKSEGREDWGVTDYCEAFSSHFVLADMGVNRLSRDATSNAGSQIKRTATFNIPTYIPQPVERVAAYASSLDAAQAELDLDMSFEFTDDVGRTWSTPETVPIYQNGQHAQRVTVFRQGQIETPGRTYRLSVISDAARVTLGPAYVNEAEH